METGSGVANNDSNAFKVLEGSDDEWEPFGYVKWIKK